MNLIIINIMEKGCFIKLKESDIIYLVIDNNLGCDIYGDERSFKHNDVDYVIKTDFKFGPIQTKWIEELEANPEKQMKDCLGFVDDDNNLIEGCCLGMAEVCISKISGSPIIKIKNDDKYILTSNNNEFTLGNYKNIGLNSNIGNFKNKFIIVYIEKIFGKNCDGIGNFLAYLNDNVLTWPEIAILLKTFPENFFNESK